jgi:hypothetical protein
MGVEGGELSLTVRFGNDAGVDLLSDDESGGERRFDETNIR